MNASITTLPAVQPARPPAAQPTPVWRGVIPTDMDTALRMAKAIAQSGMAPRSYYEGNADPIAAVFTAMQLGGEVGLSPMASIQNIAIINGRPGLFGPAMLAVVEASGKLVDIEEHIEGEGDDRVAVCTVQRVGRKPRSFRFGVRDAKRAGLWDKRGKNGQPGPWQQYPDRMLQARARSFALRDVFPDVLLGLPMSAEELGDIPADEVPAPKSAAVADLPKDITPSKPVGTFRLEGLDQEFPSTGRGWLSALDAIAAGDTARLALLNAEFLERAGERFPEPVADIRAKARRALTPETPDDLTDEALGIPDDFPVSPTATPVTYDPETGEVVEAIDAIAQKVRERRGAAPPVDDADIPA